MCANKWYNYLSSHFLSHDKLSLFISLFLSLITLYLILTFSLFPLSLFLSLTLYLFQCLSYILSLILFHLHSLSSHLISLQFLIFFFLSIFSLSTFSFFRSLLSTISPRYLFFLFNIGTKNIFLFNLIPKYLLNQTTILKQ